MDMVQIARTLGPPPGVGSGGVLVGTYRLEPSLLVIGLGIEPWGTHYLKFWFWIVVPEPISLF
jgi:hypothetical protein